MKEKTNSRNNLVEYGKLLANDEPILAKITDVGYKFACAVYEQMDKIGLKPTYRKIMVFLNGTDSATQLELVNNTGLKAPTVSLVLREMEKKGLVSREKRNEDRRETYVSLTEKGKKLYQKHYNAVNQIQTKILKEISASDREVVERVLDKISCSLETL